MDTKQQNIQTAQEHCQPDVEAPSPALLPETAALIPLIDEALRGMDLIDRCKTVSRITDVLAGLNVKRSNKQSVQQIPSEAVCQADPPDDYCLPLTIGQRIKALRVLNGFTQETLCEVNKDINRASIVNWEIGSWKPRMESLISLSATLGCDPGLLMFGKGELSNRNWQMLLPRKSDGWCALALLLESFLREMGYTHVRRDRGGFRFSGAGVEDATIVVPEKIVGLFDIDVAMEFTEDRP